MSNGKRPSRPHPWMIKKVGDTFTVIDAEGVFIAANLSGEDASLIATAHEMLDVLTSVYVSMAINDLSLVNIKQVTDVLLRAQSGKEPGREPE